MTESGLSMTFSLLSSALNTLLLLDDADVSDASSDAAHSLSFLVSSTVSRNYRENRSTDFNGVGLIISLLRIFRGFAHLSFVYFYRIIWLINVCSFVLI